MAPHPIQKKKKRPFPVVLLLVTLLCSLLVYSSLTPSLPKPGEPPRLYSHQARRDLRLTFLEAIRRAQESIYLVMFGLTDPSLLSALSQKITQEIPTTIYYDTQGSPNLRKALPKGGQIHPIHNPGLMHQKILILDDETVFIGSANFTVPSLKMHDNLVVGFSNKKAARYLREHAPHSSGSLRTFVGGQSLDLWLLPDPRGHALLEIRKKLRTASRSIRVALFTFTHSALVEELLRAHQRGVAVTVVLDMHSGFGASAATLNTLKRAGIRVLMSQGVQLLHHKFALIDEKTLITGSANWTKAAFTKNSDCLLILHTLNREQRRFLSSLWRRLEVEAKLQK